MQKVKVIDRKSEKAIKYERQLLQKLKHPFIVNMHCAFQDYDNLYLVMDCIHKVVIFDFIVLHISVLL